MSSSSSSSSSSNSNEQNRDWLDLPSDVTANILQRLGVPDIIQNAQRVCTVWRRICKHDPAMNILFTLLTKSVFRLWRTRQIRRLELVFHHGDVQSIPLMRYSFLEELNLYSTGVYTKKEFIETAGRYCTMLKTLKVNKSPFKGYSIGDANEIAIAIGENLHELRHLELIGSCMHNNGLQAILDGCHRLETLDLRKCILINLYEDLGRRCLEQIGSVKLPNDSLEDSPYSYIHKVDPRELYLYEDDYYEPMSPELYDGYISQ
uniref:putative F-box/LRR-repeat protein 23 n=1 Tax=Erigeron canadensis TaxID=72917 RepID=UPI001CB91A7E|nr:putative F-box/LRR-repeat protein 23 [Erigeron canadensis]